MSTQVEKRGGIYFIKLDDGSKAYLATSKEGGVLKLIETYTPPKYRGKGLAKKLIEKAIEDAVSEGLKIEPICSYALRYFISNPDKRHLLIEELRNKSDEELKKIFEERLKHERSKKHS